MRITAMLAFVAVVQFGSASMAAQQLNNGLSPNGNTFGNLFAPRSKPSSPRFLFPTPAPTLNQHSSGHVAQEPTVVCGLTLIPGNPNIDPAIRREVPDGGPRFSIRSVEPTACRRS